MSTRIFTDAEKRYRAYARWTCLVGERKGDIFELVDVRENFIDACRCLFEMIETKAPDEFQLKRARIYLPCSEESAYVNLHTHIAADIEYKRVGIRR